MWRIIVGLMFLLVGSEVFAQTKDQCIPYRQALAGVPCGSGYTGTKFPLRIKTCPDGRVSEGVEFETGNCKPVGYQEPSAHALNCAVTPQTIGCFQKPIMKGCDPGYHWTTMGTGIAHCVKDDMACPWGFSLTHDSIGNPSCKQNTCSSNLVLQGDGISCGCPASLPILSGGSCMAVTCPADTSVPSACGSGFTGVQYTLTKYSVSGASCVSSNSVDRSNCQSVTCPADLTEAVSCPGSQVGTAYRTTRYYVSGSSCASNVSTDTSQCTTPTCPAASTEFVACPSGQTGSVRKTTTYSLSGASCIASVFNDSSECKASCETTTWEETMSCDAGYTGLKTRNASQNSCTKVISYSVWSEKYCTAINPPEPIEYKTVQFYSFDATDSTRCSFQSWLYGYKGTVKVSEELQAKADGFVESGTGMCILY